MCNLTFEQFTHRQGGRAAGHSPPAENRATQGSASAEAECSSDADRRLSENVAQAIVEGNCPIQSVTAECHHGAVYLSGFVSSWHHKQLVQESVRGVPGVQGITNAIQVESAAQLPD